MPRVSYKDLGLFVNIKSIQVGLSRFLKQVGSSTRFFKLYASQNSFMQVSLVSELRSPSNNIVMERAIVLLNMRYDFFLSIIKLTNKHSILTGTSISGKLLKVMFSLINSIMPPIYVDLLSLRGLGKPGIKKEDIKNKLSTFVSVTNKRSSLLDTMSDSISNLFLRLFNVDMGYGDSLIIFELQVG